MDIASNIKLLHYFIDNHLNFLTLKDSMNLLLTSKAIHKLETSFSFLVHIGQRCVDPNHPYSRAIRRYFKKLLLRFKAEVSDKTILQIKTIKDLETKYVLSRNAILNPSGIYKFQGWKITANSGHGWKVIVWRAHPSKKTCFEASYLKNRMHYTIPIEKFLTPGITVKELMERARFKGGICIVRGQSTFAHGEASLIAYDSKGNQLSKNKVSVGMFGSYARRFEEENASFANHKIEISFNPAEIKDKTIKLLRLVISGYGSMDGPRFSDAYVRCYYNDIEGVDSALDISLKKTDREITLKEESGMIEENNEFPKYDDSHSDLGPKEYDDDPENGSYW